MNMPFISNPNATNHMYGMKKSRYLPMIYHKQILDPNTILGLRLVPGIFGAWHSMGMSINNSPPTFQNLALRRRTEN
jgi:hypothetical protein